LDPSSFDRATDEIIRCHDRYGFKGLVLDGDWEGFTEIGSVQMQPYLAMADAWRWPVFFHTGTYPTSPPGRLIEVARRYPRLVMIAAHLGYDMIEDAITAATMCPNVYVETSANATPSGMFEVIRRCGAHKVLYGSGLPYAFPDHHQEILRRLPGLSDADRSAVLGGNLLRLLRIA
jgi:predicted TIM-barrel fold metal-dependent hydrolase